MASLQAMDGLSLGDRLVEARARSGMARTEASRRSGIPVRTLARYEAGVTKPGTDRLAEIAAVYGVPIGWFLSCVGESRARSNDQTDRTA